MKATYRLGLSAGLLTASCLAASLSAAPTPQERGWVPLHGPLHIHTPFSHDACDGEGLMPDGSPNPECRATEREAFCLARHDFYLLTDHPSNMQVQTVEDLVLYTPNEGDELILSDIGIEANRILCTDGETSWTTLLTTGLEGSHNMPVGLEAHLADPGLYSTGFGTGEDSLEAIEEIAQIHEAGGVALLAHAEQDDVTASRLVELPLDGVELYNAHANIEKIMYTRPLQLLKIEPWMDPDLVKNYDLIALMMLEFASELPTKKWDEALMQKPLSAVIGTDVHANVILDPYCAPGSPFVPLCNLLQPMLPNMEAYLEVGGPIPLGDGERLDSFRRMFRWFSNHVLTTGRSMAAVKEALAAGRSYASFDILGQPEGFDFYLQDSSTGKLTEMGGTALNSSTLKLYIRVPEVSYSDYFADWTPVEAAAAQVRIELFRISSSGTTRINANGSAGELVEIKVPGPGAYRVEVFIQPEHLRASLGDQAAYADGEYRWLWGNPLYVKEGARQSGTRLLAARGQ